ncbi:hypothetical protein EUTSA_v10015706mg [Eutrema salsugineum]|uniref:F-box associated beta-propeller type 3 domain-containing protein n=1 Tax=Eutrema salsugineum TaxID=72664 RepID=V4LHP1_EUTSA|nr:putative F-box protein At5g52620 [Eutrema salsugineum]ESQ43254.1 hypothetical protein EUTSA_v10015706mg [Eutrema salsugineum]
MKRKASRNEISVKRKASRKESRKENSDHLPIDIILEILSRSSAKSVATFGLASKFYASMLSRPDFTDLFLTRSLTRPRLLFAVKYHRRWCFFSSPQLQNLVDEKPSLVVEAEFLKDFRDIMCPEICRPVSSLVLLPRIRISKENRDHTEPVICNPSTGQYTTLPQLRRISHTRSLFGYDPIGKQYKVLAISKSEQHIVVIPTSGNVSWRKISLLNHYPKSEGICIDGVLYYGAETKGVNKIACFNVRHEKLGFLEAHSYAMNIFLRSNYKLINYKGKLGMINWSWYGPLCLKPKLKLCLWILEDAEGHEWSMRNYKLSPNIVVEGDVSVVGVTTATGEIILSMDYAFKPFFVFYFNPERNTLRKVGIQGFKESENPARVYTFVDYTEDLKFI